MMILFIDIFSWSAYIIYST